MELNPAKENTEAASVTASQTLDANGKLNPLVLAAEPEFGDAKVAGRIFGFCRAHLYNLATAGKIRSACIRRPGAFRGRRLYDLASIRAFLEASIDPPSSIPEPVPSVRPTTSNPLA